MSDRRLPDPLPDPSPDPLPDFTPASSPEGRQEDGVLAFPQGGMDGEDEALAARVRALYAATPRSERAAADVARAVLDDPQVLRAGSWRRLVPRQRWWWGAAAAALLVAVTMRPWRPGAVAVSADSVLTAAGAAAGAAASAGSPRSSVTAPAGGGVVRFDLTLPSAARVVSLVGDFNGWSDAATPMVQRAADGTWSAEVSLPPGRHVYAFVVDGARWLVDPMAPQVPDAGYGPANALLVVGAR